MISLSKTRYIIQAPSGTDLSSIKPKLHKKSTLKPLKHQMYFGGRTFSYSVPNDDSEYFLYQRNQTRGIMACTLQERLENEEWIVRDVLDFGEKLIFQYNDKRLTKEFQEKQKKISKLVVREEEISHKKKMKLNGFCKEKDEEILEAVVIDAIDFGEEEEEIFHKMEKKLKQELQEKDQKIAALKKRIKVFSREYETLQKMLLKNFEKQVCKAGNEQFKRFQEEFGCIKEGQEVAQN